MGTPVITTTASSLPEVVGEAGKLVPPENEESLTSALSEIASDSDLRRRLSLAGRNQAARFRWERMAAETAAV